MSPGHSLRIFISYSHRGRGPEWKTKLITALKVFEQHQLLDVWQDGKIRLSSLWNDDIQQAMSSAGAAVLLLTKEALDSEFILKTELPFLRDRQHRDKLPVFPVVCEECNWRGHDWLLATQAPNDSNPLAHLSAGAQDHILRQLATDIATELSRITLAELPKSEHLLPAEHVYLDKFPLTRGPGLREEKLIGREQELALLDLAFAQPQTAIVSLVAWGGVGKTMLVQHWLQRLQREGWFGARRVYAWSFYSQGTKEDRQTSEDTFLAHALEWFGVQCEPTLSPWDKGRLLADAVARERTLLILDGIEPLQYPPGPMGGQLRAPGVQSLLNQLARKAVALNSQPSILNQALCLVTTRAPLTDLADLQRREGSPWGNVLRVDLGNLTEEAGAALLHHAGANRAGAAKIKPDNKELLAASREVDGHALTLNLLGRFLARAHGGDIRRRDLVKFEEADRNEQGRTTFKVLRAFETWFTTGSEVELRSLALLRMLGLFDRPASRACLEVLRQPPVILGLTDPWFESRRDAASGAMTVMSLRPEVWYYAESFLRDFSLVQIQESPGAAADAVDCHPLIREYFGYGLQERNELAFSTAHERLFRYLAKNSDFHPSTILRMQPLYEAVYHGCCAGLHEEARTTVYRNRILRGHQGPDAFYSIKKLAAFDSELRLLRGMFDGNWANPSSRLPAESHAPLMNLSSHCLIAVGRLQEAVILAAEAARRTDFLDRKNWVLRHNEYAAILSILGNLGKALDVARNTYGGSLADPGMPFDQMGLSKNRIPDAGDRMTALTTWARIVDLQGNPREARKLFEKAESDLTLLGSEEFQHSMLCSVQNFEYCELLISEATNASWRIFLHGYESHLAPDIEAIRRMVECCGLVYNRAARGLKLQETVGSVPHLDRTIARLCCSSSYLVAAILQVFNPAGFSENMEGARRELDLCLDALRTSQSSQWLPPTFLLRARISIHLGQNSRAQAELDEAWDIAERGPMRLHMADIHLHRARLFFRQKHYPWKSPQKDLASAEKLINDCGYHRRDEELADAKRAILSK